MAQSTTAAKLATSYTIKVGSASMGSIQSMTVSESRNITDSFELGHNPPDEPTELIPGVVSKRTISATYIALYTKDVLQAFGGSDAIASLSGQNASFDIVESFKNPSTGQTTSRTYSGCYISDYSSPVDISKGDIRVIQNATIVFRSVSGATA